MTLQSYAYGVVSAPDWVLALGSLVEPLFIFGNVRRRCRKEFSDRSRSDLDYFRCPGSHVALNLISPARSVIHYITLGCLQSKGIYEYR